MAMPVTLSRFRGKKDVEKRAAMKRLLIADVPLEEIATQLGYASVPAVRVMYNRWGLTDFYSRSYRARALRSDLNGGGSVNNPHPRKRKLGAMPAAGLASGPPAVKTAR